MTRRFMATSKQIRKNIITIRMFKTIVRNFRSMDAMLARSVFTVPLTFPRSEIEIPVALESYAPNMFIIGTEMGSLIGFDTRTAMKEVFRIQSDLASG